jgi:hypothetical protein
VRYKLTDEEATKIIDQFNKENPNLDYIKYFIEKLTNEDHGEYIYNYYDKKKEWISLYITYYL